MQKLLQSRFRPVQTSLLEGCAVGLVGNDGLLIHKRWRVDSDYIPLVAKLGEFRCPKDHEHSSSFDLRETQHYPEPLCRAVLSTLK